MQKFTALSVYIVLMFSCLSSPAFAEYSDGTGDPNDPYQISCVADWQELMSTYQDWGANFELTADLDFEGIELTPVGRNYPYFEGVFEGNHHTISNARINKPNSSYVGLFGYTSTLSSLNRRV